MHLTGINGCWQSSEIKPAFSLPFQLFSQRLFWDSERQIPHSGKSITFAPIWLTDHWWSAFLSSSSSTSLQPVSCWRREFLLFERDDYFCVNLCWVLWHRVKLCTQWGCAACGKRSRDTEGICTVRAVEIYKMAQLTHSITCSLRCHSDIIAEKPHKIHTKPFTSLSHSAA